MRNVIVTGGSRGVGLGIARKLAAAGYRVLAIARTEGDLLPSAIQEAAREGCGALHFHAFDLGDTANIPGLVKSLRQEFGPVYGLVNNAAVGTSGILAAMHDGQIERLVRLNTLSPLILTKYAVRSMMTGVGGRIVNVASIVGFTGFSGLAAYGATKSAMFGFTRSLAREVGSLDITVNAVAPGFLDTDMTQELDDRQRDQVRRRSALRRLADVEDVANLVAFLFDEKAKNITGTVMTVDAGGTA